MTLVTLRAAQSKLLKVSGVVDSTIGFSSLIESISTTTISRHISGYLLITFFGSLGPW